MENNKQTDISLYEEKGLSFFDLFQIIKRRMISIIVCVIVGFGLMITYSYTIQKPVYTASATVMVNPTISGSSSSINNDYTYVQKIMSTYEILFKSRLVLGEVSENIQDYSNKDGSISHLNYTVGSIYSMTTIEVLSGSVISNVDSLIFRISVSGYNADDCAIIANEIINVAKSLPSIEGDFSILRNSTLTTVDEALPNYNYSKNLFRNGVIGIALGLIFAAVYIVIREATDTTISDAKSIEDILGLNVLAIVPDIEMSEKEKYKTIKQ